MASFVVMLAPGDADLLSLGEWRRLLSSETVLFEIENHPLEPLVRQAGVSTGRLEDPDAIDKRAAVVAEPGSETAYRLAASGATLSSGPDDTLDAVTVARGAKVARRAAISTARLASIMARLRSPEGCPWDNEQTHSSLLPHLIEEAYEVVDVVERGELGADLEDELGDVLLQVAFHAQMASDDDRFDLAGVADAISAKLLRRHPHVFGDEVVETAQQVVSNWETLKAGERTERSGPFDGIPRSLPALTTTHKTQKRAASLGFTASAEESKQRAARALEDEDLGEALFWVVALARARGLDAEAALRRSLARFRASLTEGG